MVNGGSRDGSVEVAREHGIEVYVQKKRGIRHAYIEAWPLVRGDVVITFGPDGNCPPEALPKLIGFPSMATTWWSPRGIWGRLTVKTMTR